MLKVKYIGIKPTQAFRFEDLTITWYGNGDIQQVPDSFKGTIEAHSTVWEIVGHAKDAKSEMIEETKEEPVETPTLVDISNMDKASLQAYCQREFGLTVDQNWSATRLRKYVQDVMGQKMHDAR